MLSIAWGVMPSRDAVRRSMTRLAASPLFWASLVTSVSWGICLIVASSLGPHWLSSPRLSLWIVYWYWAALARPPILTSWTAWRMRVAPGTTASFGRSRSMICEAEAVRWLRGLRDMNTRPVLVVVPPPPPVKAITVATAGSSFAIAASLWIFLLIDWKEMSWSAMMLPTRRPVSCCGKKSLGMTT